MSATTTPRFAACRRSTRTARSRSTPTRSFDPANPRTYPERLSIRTGTFNENVKNHTYEAFAQDKWQHQPADDDQPRVFATISRSSRSTRPATRCSRASSKSPTDKNNISPRVSFTHSLDAGRQVGDPRRLRDLLQPDDPRRRRRHAGVRQVHRVERRHLPVEWHRRSRSERRTVPDRPVPGQRPVRQPHPAQRRRIRRVCRCGTTAS